MMERKTPTLHIYARIHSDIIRSGYCELVSALLPTCIRHATWITINLLSSHIRVYKQTGML